MKDNKGNELFVADTSDLIDARNKLIKELQYVMLLYPKAVTQEEIEIVQRELYFIDLLSSRYSILNEKITRLEFLMRYCMVDIISAVNEGTNVRIWLPSKVDSLTCEDIDKEHLKYFIDAMEIFICND